MEKEMLAGIVGVITALIAAIVLYWANRDVEPVNVARVFVVLIALSCGGIAYLAILAIHNIIEIFW